MSEKKEMIINPETMDEIVHATGQVLAKAPESIHAIVDGIIQLVSNHANMIAENNAEKYRCQQEMFSKLLEEHAKDNEGEIKRGLMLTEDYIEERKRLINALIEAKTKEEKEEYREWIKLLSDTYGKDFLWGNQKKTLIDKFCSLFHK